MNPRTRALDASFGAMAPELLAIDQDLHRHPELRCRWTRTRACTVRAWSPEWRIPAGMTSTSPAKKPDGFHQQPWQHRNETEGGRYRAWRSHGEERGGMQAFAAFHRNRCEAAQNRDCD